MGHGLSQKKTLPKPLYTEATLLTAMENCGKEITDGQAREAVKDTGIGTPATRAAIITTLLKRDYIERSGKSIRPTEKGLYLYESVKDMMVADAKLTGTWEKALEQLFSSGSTRLIKGFKGKKGVSFDAAIIFDESFNLKLSFPKSKGGKGK